ncbi:MAG TPA: glycosyltransferase family 87 protein [Allosphingosinicella sp.]
MLNSKAGRLPDQRLFFFIVTVFLTLFLFLYHDARAALADTGLSVGRDVIFGRDFANVFTGGQLVMQGKLPLLYDIEGYRAYQTALFEGAVREHNYSYSPVSFLYVWLFALLPYLWSYLLWIVVTGAAFIWAARPYLRTVGLPGWIAFLLPASIVNIWAGHYGFLFGALWLGAWRLLDSRPRLAGMLIGFMIVKPHLAVLMPFVLARRGARTAFFFAGLSVVCLIAVSIAFFGLTPWLTYLTSTASFQASLVDKIEAFFVTMMPTLAPVLFMAGLPEPLVWTAQTAVALSAFIALMRYLPEDTERAGFATAHATFLILPYAFIYDMTVLSVASILLLTQLGKEERPWRIAAAYLGLLLPLTTIFYGKAGIPIAPIIIALQFAMFLTGVSRFSARPAAPAALAEAH